MKPARSDAAERILREAMRLFAERGYERTSVPDIQEAAGLTRGSGAMYKHYPSKEAVLRAGVERYVAEAQAARARLRKLELPPREALGAVARRTLEMMAGKRDELRILWRDVEQFRSLQATARREIMQSTYAAVADWLRERSRKGELRDHDSDAVAAVILGSLTMFRAFEALWGERTINVDDERFLRAWHDLVARGLGLDAPPAKDKSASRRTPRRKQRT